MTITLEQIEEMNLQIGEPIELEKHGHEIIFTEIGYFQKIEDGYIEYSIMKDSFPISEESMNKIPLRQILSIKKLRYVD